MVTRRKFVALLGSALGLGVLSKVSGLSALSSLSPRPAWQTALAAAGKNLFNPSADIAAQYQKGTLLTAVDAQALVNHCQSQAAELLAVQPKLPLLHYEVVDRFVVPAPPPWPFSEESLKASVQAMADAIDQHCLEAFMRGAPVPPLVIPPGKQWLEVTTKDPVPWRVIDAWIG